MEEFIFRAVERILDVTIGGFAIYLGYRLFLKLPEQTDSSGKVILPGGVNVCLSRIGPGIFFSLFGAVIVALSLYQQMEVGTLAEPRGGNQNVSKGSQTKSIRYFGNEGQPTGDKMLAPMRSEANRTIFELNRLPHALLADLPMPKRNDINQAIRESKLAVVHSVWGKDWGDYGQFKSWIDKGESGPAPEEFDLAAVELFRNGQQEKTP